MKALGALLSLVLAAQPVLAGPRAVIKTKTGSPVSGQAGGVAGVSLSIPAAGSTLNNPTLKPVLGGGLTLPSLQLQAHPELQPSAASEAQVPSPLLPVEVSKKKAAQRTAIESKVEGAVEIPGIGPAASVAEEGRGRSEGSSNARITVPKSVGSLLNDPFAAAPEGESRMTIGQRPSRQPQLDMAPMAGIPRVNYADLDKYQIKWIDEAANGEFYQNLRFVLTDDAVLKETLHKFMREQPEGMNSIFSGMFLSLRSVADSGFDMPTRQRLMAGLLMRFNEVFAELYRDETMPYEVRKRSYDILLHFMAHFKVLQEFARKREVEAKFMSLKALVKEAKERANDPNKALEERASRQAPALDMADEKMEWKISPSATKRITTDHAEDFWFSLDAYKQSIEQAHFGVQKLLTRYELAVRNDFRAAFIEARRLELVRYLERIAPVIQDMTVAVPRYISVTLQRTWEGWDMSKRPPYVWVPDNANLRLAEEPGGYVLRARFETDIESPVALQAIKVSIERHWTGAFIEGGRAVGFRTEITIVPLLPRQQFSEGALKLQEASFAQALADFIGLPRHFDADEAAHEFGHVMGLPDDYAEAYVSNERRGKVTSNPGSLMGGHRTGVVQFRHLKTVVKLLKVNSLEPRPSLRQLRLPETTRK